MTTLKIMIIFLRNKISILERFLKYHVTLAMFPFKVAKLTFSELE